MARCLILVTEAGITIAVHNQFMQLYLTQLFRSVFDPTDMTESAASRRRATDVTPGSGAYQERLAMFDHYPSSTIAAKFRVSHAGILVSCVGPNQDETYPIERSQHPVRPDTDTPTIQDILLPFGYRASVAKANLSCSDRPSEATASNF